MNKINYDAEMRRVLAGRDGARVLLHACCAPCASHCMAELVGSVRLTAYFYNPNLDSAEEYEKRRTELERFARETGYADLLPCAYAPQDFAEIAAGYEDAPEGGARCTRCFALRLERTAQAAKAGGFDLFATTLTLSPLKDAERINRIGFAMGEKYGVEYLPSDFKKRGGYQHSIALSREHCLYRQNYCGCAFSKNI